MRLSLLRRSALWLALAGLALSLSATAAPLPRQDDGAKRISLNELSALLKKDKPSQPLVVDVRDADSFRAGHIKGAVNIPYGDVASRLKEFPKNRLIVTYCS